MYNRIEQEWNNWKVREQRFEAIVPGTLHRNLPFQREKLKFLDNLSAKYEHLTVDERILLRILSEEKRQIEQKLYPGILQRIARALIFPFVQQLRVQSFKRKAEHNDQELRTELMKAGFGDIYPQVSEKLRTGQPSFSIPVKVATEVNGQIEYQLHFSNQLYENPKFEKFEAILSIDSKEQRRHTFVPAELQHINAREAYNLLAGRSVEVLSPDPGITKEQWMHFDLNDKDANGNYKIVTSFCPPLDVEALLNRQSIIGDKAAIANLLRKGERVMAARDIKGSKESVGVELHAKTGRLALYDSTGKKKQLPAKEQASKVPNGVENVQHKTTQKVRSVL